MHLRRFELATKMDYFLIPERVIIFSAIIPLSVGVRNEVCIIIFCRIFSVVTDC